jgi:hypothetical protein
MSQGTAGSNGRTSSGGSKAPSGICAHLQLADGFKKSLSMSGEVGSLAGDRVVSHERSRPADLPPTRPSVATRGALSFGLLGLVFLLCSSGTWSSLPEGCDAPIRIERTTS